MTEPNMAIVCKKCKMDIWGKDVADCEKLMEIHKRSECGKRPNREA